MAASKPYRVSNASKRARRVAVRVTTRTTDDDLHSVLRDSFVSPDAARGKRGISTLSERLKRDQGMIPKALLGVAIWNQVPRYDASSGAPPPTLDPSLEQLLKTVLGLDAAAVFTVRSNPSYDVFPPYPDQVILDSRYAQQQRGNTMQATLETCVPTSKDEPPTFECLRLIADPRTWSAANFFWPQIEERDPRDVVKEPKTKRSIHAQLNLPVLEGARVQPITLKILAFNDHPLSTQIRFSAGRNSLLKLYRGQITVQKEPGRPGAVRIINQKTVQFAEPLNAHADETLKYWLHAETACLVMRS